MKNSSSIKNTKDIVKTLSVGIEAIFSQKVKEYSTYLQGEPLTVLDLKKFMKDSKQYKAEQELVEILNKETIGDAKMLMEGMCKEIERLLERDQTAMPLSDLKTEWL